jgi:bifunctional ADP-heptose synthase (sugar kinase/adenylyltransferase)
MKEKDLKILVIGENCTDKFIYCDIKRLSPEAPIPVLNPIKTTCNPGMAGNVVANLEVLSPKAEIISLFSNNKITKTRYVDYKTNHMFIRVDRGEEDVTPLVWTPGIEDTVKWADIVIVSDYNKGYLDNTVLYNIGHLAKLSILDSKRVLTQDILDKFSFIKLNESESRNNYGLKHPGLIITLGSKGAYYGGEIIPQENPQQTIDVSGAGDTFIAAFMLKFFETLEEIPSIEYANKMASIVVSKRGVVTPV